MRAEILLTSLLLATPNVLAQSQTSVEKGGLLDPNRTFSDQSVAPTEFRSLLKDMDIDLVQAEKNISAMRPDSLAVEYRLGKSFDDNRAYCTLAIDGTRRLIAAVQENDLLRPEIQLILSLGVLDGCLADFQSFLSNLDIPNHQNVKVALNWSDELQGLRKKFLLRTPRIEFYILGRAERLDLPSKK